MDFKEIERLSQAAAKFREPYPDANLLTFQVFLDIAINPGIPSVELIRKTGASQSAISRHLMLLSNWTWQGTRPSLDLIEMRPDTSARRVPFLTSKGMDMACSLMRILEPETHVAPTDFAAHCKREPKE